MSDFEILEALEGAKSLIEKLTVMIERNIEDRSKGSAFDRKQYELQLEKLKIQKAKKVLSAKNKEITQKKYNLEGAAKVKCDCGAIICINSMTSHIKTNKHSNKLKKLAKEIAKEIIIDTPEDNDNSDSDGDQ